MMPAGSMFRGRRRPTGRPPSGRSRRGFEWENLSIFGSGITTAENSSEVMTAAEIDELSQSATFARIRGQAVVGSGAVSQSFVAWMGLCFLPNSVAVGTAGVPSALADGNWNGWLWHSGFPLITGSAIDSLATTTGAVRQLIDNRAMRRLLEDTHLVFVVSKVGAVTVLNFNVALRFGIMTARR